VSRAEMTLGNVVSTGANAPVLTTLVSLSPIYASFDVDEQTYLRYLSRRSGSSTPVSMGLANEVGFSREGEVNSVDNQMDTGSGTIRVRAIFDNADYSLVPGLVCAHKSRGRVRHMPPSSDVRGRRLVRTKTRLSCLLSTSQTEFFNREVTIESERDGLSVVTSGLRPGREDRCRGHPAR